MPEHYYTQTPASAHRPDVVETVVMGEQFKFHTDAGVFSRDALDYGSRLLIESLPELEGRVLDFGCGWGAVGIALAKKYRELSVVMTDVNERAVELSKKNAKENKVTGVLVIQGDGFEHVDGLFDAIITNPPIRAGKQVIYSMFREAKQFLKPGGALYIVIRKQQGAQSALNHLKEVYGSAELIERDKGYWIIKAEKKDSEEGA